MKLPLILVFLAFTTCMCSVGIFLKTGDDPENPERVIVDLDDNLEDDHECTHSFGELDIEESATQETPIDSLTSGYRLMARIFISTHLGVCNNNLYLGKDLFKQWYANMIETDEVDSIFLLLHSPIFGIECALSRLKTEGNEVV
mgnify:CR=1 FL=1